jgi:drug/metabolite transporter (DMT)-like permease
MLAKKTLSDLPAIAPVAAALTISAIVLTPLAAFSLPDHAPPFKAWGSVVVLGTACTAIALVVFFVLLTEAGPSRASVITYVNPVVAVTLGVAFLDESLGAASLAGLLLILAGSYVSTGGRFRRTPVRRGAPPPHGEADRALQSASAAEASGVDAR